MGCFFYAYMKYTIPINMNELTCDDVQNRLTDAGTTIVTTKLKLTGNRNQCPTCSRYFNSITAFDAHRTGIFGEDRRCLTVHEMQSHGMALNSAGFWVASNMDSEGWRAGELADFSTGMQVDTHDCGKRPKSQRSNFRSSQEVTLP
jgi:hypothetical protein